MGLEKGQQGMGDFMDGGVEDGLKGEGAAKPGHLEALWRLWEGMFVDGGGVIGWGVEQNGGICHRSI